MAVPPKPTVLVKVNALDEVCHEPVGLSLVIPPGKSGAHRVALAIASVCVDVFPQLSYAATE